MTNYTFKNVPLLTSKGPDRYFEDRVGTKIGEGTEEESDQFFFTELKTGLVYSVDEDTFHGAKPVTTTSK